MTALPASRTPGHPYTELVGTLHILADQLIEVAEQVVEYATERTGLSDAVRAMHDAEHEGPIRWCRHDVCQKAEQILN